jgi:hypothetical protein
MPLMHSEYFQRLFPKGVKSSSPCFCSSCSFQGAIPVQRVILLPAAANSFRGPPFPWVRISLTKVPLRRANPAQRVIVLPAAVTSSRGPKFLCVPIFLKRFLFHHALVEWRDTFLQAAANFPRDHNLFGSIPLASRDALADLEAPVPLLPSFQLVKLYGKQWPKPTREMWRKIADDSYAMWQFPNCIGAIYRMQFEIQAPRNGGSFSFICKKTFSLVRLALVGANYKFNFF